MSDNTRYEPTDLSSRRWGMVTAIFLFGMGLILVVVFVFKNMVLDQPTKDVIQSRPQKNSLLTDQGKTFNKYKRNQDSLLSTYSWISREQGLAKIPVERAKKIILERIKKQQDSILDTVTKERNKNPEKSSQSKMLQPVNASVISHVFILIKKALYTVFEFNNFQSQSGMRGEYSNQDRGHGENLNPSEADKIMSQIGWEQNVGKMLPLDEKLIDEKGNKTSLKNLIDGKPSILALGYYQCPMLCKQVLGALQESVKVLKLQTGDDFNIIVLTVDHTESIQDAFERKKQLLGSEYEEKKEGWKFLTADSASIQAIASSLGFGFAKIPESEQFAHPAGIVVTTSGGMISQYFPGLEYPPRDLQFRLQQASGNKLGSPVDKAVLACFQYNPQTGTYSLAILRLLRWFGTATAIVLLGGIIYLKRGESKNSTRKDKG